MIPTASPDLPFMRRALRLARRAFGQTAPNPMVGAVLVKAGRVIGQGWHHRAGEPHAEIEAMRDAQVKGNDPAGATLYVTLEPCSTQGRTPPCTAAIKTAQIKRVIAAATDPNPAHSGRGFELLDQAGIEVHHGLLAEAANRLNEAFNHWIVHRIPFVTLKAAMTLDGKIATAVGESKWVTSQKARVWSMKLRQGADAILVGSNTVLADDPSLTVRLIPHPPSPIPNPKRRFILDSRARTPLAAQVVSDPWASWTTVVVTPAAPARRVAALAKRVQVWVAPADRKGRVDLRWLVKRLGDENVTHLLVEGGGEINAAFLFAGLVQRVVFFYAPKILGGRGALKAVAGQGAQQLSEVINLRQIQWRRLGPDLMLTARVG